MRELQFLFQRMPGALFRRVGVWACRRLLGYRIEAGASLGLCFIQAVDVSLGAGSRVRHFTIIRNIARLDLSARARFGTFNWIFGMVGPSTHFDRETDRRSALVFEDDSAITSRHIIDCTDTVTLGRFSTVAGFRSQILTHGIDISVPRQSCAPVRIGPYALIGSGCIVLKGSVLPEGTVLAAGSTFGGAHQAPHQLWSGVPAVPVKALDPSLGYFVRRSGAVR